MASLDSLDLDSDNFILVSCVIGAILYSVSWMTKCILSKSMRMEQGQLSLISRRIGAISIHMVCLLLLSQTIYLFLYYNEWIYKFCKYPLNAPISSKDDPNEWEPNILSSQFDVRVYIFHIKYFFKQYYYNFMRISVPYSVLSIINKLTTLTLLIDVSYNIIDSLTMFFQKNGFSATFNPLVLLHHWIILWMESCFFNLELFGSNSMQINVPNPSYDFENNNSNYNNLNNININGRNGKNIHSNGRNFSARDHPVSNTKLVNYSVFCWFIAITAFVLIFASVLDLILAPSTAVYTQFEKSKIRKILLGFHYYFSLILRVGGIGLVSTLFLMRMWLNGWKYGVSFQIAWIILEILWFRLSQKIYQEWKHGELTRHLKND